MKRTVAVQWTIRAIATAVALAASVPAYAQGCAMCYNTASAAKADAIQALRSGTLVLLFPVLLLFGGILWMAFRSRNRYYQAENAEAVGAAVLAGSLPLPDDAALWRPSPESEVMRGLSRERSKHPAL
jgi:hypothetical protein